MPWIYGYLLTWVSGGVVLAASLLLEQPNSHPTARFPKLATLWQACLGFGGVGLATEATLPFDAHPALLGSPQAALCGAVLLVLVGYPMRHWGAQRTPE